ncbi:MAG: EAL domain-containing protein [Gammaproteobacteria bacterium]|nr:EAL domain-containing protein [Gammaproteobacteria bacterium]MBU1625082.1 EAL domain-containing protein [Gammaproteobacteria bacterium]MBU1981342.1 EAL domain-containing protein [Gammaproteobacteria bacterium]
MQKRTLFRTIRNYVAALAVIATASALVFAISYTESSLPWTAFLTGVLVAAILAEAVRASRSEWLLMRRTAQLAAIKSKLEREALLRKHADQKNAADRPRLQIMDDSLSTMVALFDTKGQCHYHNRAFHEWLGMRPEQIDNHLIREILGPKVGAEIATAVRQSLDGQEVRYERTQAMANGALYHLSITHIPQYDEAGKVNGFYFLADDITDRSDLNPAQTSANEQSDTGNGHQAGQELYIDAFSEQLTGQKDAGKRIITAIEQGEFRLFCQLISPLPPNSVGAAHYEILIRLQEEEEGLLPPGAFFPLAEKHGLMPYLDRWVIQHVLAWSASHSRKDSMFFINLAAATLGDPEFPEFLKSTLQEYEAGASSLCFEVTDAELAQRGENAAEFIRQVRACGCRVALSGFGRDNVSFDRIRGFQVDFIKIDGSLILGLLRDPVNLAKVSSIDRVAKKIGVRTVAELVESDELITKLSELGIDYAQGFGISRPRALEE